MVDHFSQLRVRNTGINLDGVPTLLVHLITGPDLFVTVTQVKRQIRLALYIHSGVHIVESCQREHFSADFEHYDIGPERRALYCARFAQAILAELREIHHAIRSPKIAGRSCTATRSCFIESRSRNVTVSRSEASFSPSVSKSMVTPKGVPIS